MIFSQNLYMYSMMDKTQKEHVLSQYYFDVNNPGSFLGAVKLHNILNTKYPGIFTIHFIQKWLDNQDSYAVQKQVIRKHKSPNVQVAGLNDQADVYLMSVENISKYNDEVRYLLIVIHILSRFLLVRAIKNKKSQTVISAFKDIFSIRKFTKIRTDKGSEFVNHEVKSFMKKQGIYLFNTQSISKANYAERVIRTLRSMMFRMLRQNRNYRYIDHLQNIANNYNNSPHRSLNGLTPSSITNKNAVQVWSMLYLKPKKFPNNKPHFKFKVGDLVRLSYTKHPFRRAYQQQYTTEVFRIKSRIYKQNIAYYKIIDLNALQNNAYIF